jgi:ribose 5-phosphate isomerase A
LDARSHAFESEKLAAAREAARLIAPGMTVGLGSGSTVKRLIDVLAESPLDATFVAASVATASAAEQHGVRVVALDDVARLDLAIDGADQIAPDWWLIKGGGAAHTREKIIAEAARSFVVIASSNKLVDRLRPPVPLELLAFAPDSTLAALGEAQLRAHTLPSPDGGLIADFLGPLDDPRELAHRFEQQPGVVEHGLFPPELVDLVIVGSGTGIVEVARVLDGCRITHYGEVPARHD